MGILDLPSKLLQGLFKILRLPDWPKRKRITDGVFKPIGPPKVPRSRNNKPPSPSDDSTQRGRETTGE